MVEYVRCMNPSCREISREGRLSREWDEKRGNFHSSCPLCGFDRFEPVQGICDTCEKAEALPDDDLCAKCVQAEEAEALDYIAAQALGEQRAAERRAEERRRSMRAVLTDITLPRRSMLDEINELRRKSA